MLRSRVAISELAYLLAFGVAGERDRPAALVRPPRANRVIDAEFGADLRRLTDQAWAELREYGLARGTELHPDLVDTFRFLTHAPQEFYGFFSVAGDESTRSVLGVGDRDDAMLVVLDDGGLTFVPIQATGLTESVVGVLPQVPPARSRSYTFPAGGGQPDEGNVYEPEEDTRGGGFAEARQILRRPRTGGGQLLAARRDRYGDRRRCAFPLTYLDTVDGRFLLTQERSGNGETWVTLAPADNAALADRFRRLLAGIED